MRGDTLQGGDTRVKSDSDEQKKLSRFRGDTAELRDIQTVITKKSPQFFQEKNKGDTLGCHPW